MRKLFPQAKDRRADDTAQAGLKKRGVQFAAQPFRQGNQTGGVIPQLKAVGKQKIRQGVQGQSKGKALKNLFHIMLFHTESPPDHIGYIPFLAAAGAADNLPLKPHFGGSASVQMMAVCAP